MKYATYNNPKTHIKYNIADKVKKIFLILLMLLALNYIYFSLQKLII